MEIDIIFDPWVQILRTGQYLQDRIDTTLRAEGLPNLAWYDVLLELMRAHPAPMRPFELEENLLLKQYNLSRQISRMVKAGVMEKLPAEGDGRGFSLMITAKGLQQRQEMWEIYSSVLHQTIGSKLTISEAESLINTLRKLRP